MNLLFLSTPEVTTHEYCKLVDQNAGSLLFTEVKRANKGPFEVALEPFANHTKDHMVQKPEGILLSVALEHEYEWFHPCCGAF